MATHPHTAYRAAAVLLLAAIALAIAFSDRAAAGLHVILAFATRVINAHPVWGVVIFVLASALSAMLAFFSTAVIVPVAVYAWGAPATALLLWTGWLIGGICSYTIGRTLGRRVTKWLIRPERLAYYEPRMARAATFPLVLLFQLALPSEVPGYVLGTIRYRFPAYLLALAIAEMPFAIGAVYLGATFIQREYALLVGIAVAGAVFTTIAMRLFHRRIEA